MTLDEFHEVYGKIGEVGAALLVGEVDCDLDELVEHYPRLSHLWRPGSVSPLPLSSFWWGVVRTNPDNIKYCPIGCLESYHWSDLVRRHPQLREYCEWSKLNNLQWGILLELHPEFTCYRDLEK